MYKVIDGRSKVPWHQRDPICLLGQVFQDEEKGPGSKARVENSNCCNCDLYPPSSGDDRQREVRDLKGQPTRLLAWSSSNRELTTWIGRYEPL